MAVDLTRVDAPVRALLERTASFTSPDDQDLLQIGAVLVELARDHDYLAPRITAMGEHSGALPLHLPERGPRLILVHRSEGQMGAVHDHAVWVAIAPIVGIETHRHYRLADLGTSGERAELVEELALKATESVALLPPDDLHAHGHVLGRGEPAYILIMTGDDQFRYRRNEWDLATGRHRVLEPGERGRWLATEPFADGR
jgi:predicted metal-dependent enzyme (double-stranded beta helix superfamily)